MTPKNLVKPLSQEDLEELAAKVSNDISEGIDGGETREQLRAVISWWADLAVREATERASCHGKMKLAAAAKKLLDVAIVTP